MRQTPPRFFPALFPVAVRPSCLGNRPLRFPCRFLIALWRHFGGFLRPPSGSSLFLCSPFSFRSPSFLFLGINRSRWEDSTRGERIRLFPSLPPFFPRPRGTNGRTQKLPSGGAATGRQTGGQRTNQPLLAIGGCGHGILLQGWEISQNFGGGATQCLANPKP